jgi:hypothetical protein
MSQGRAFMGFGMTWVCVLAATLHAERAPLPPARLVEESDLVLTGQILAHKIGTESSHVQSGFGNYDWAIDLTLKIQSVEKGEKGRFDQSVTLIVRCFRMKTRKSIGEFESVSGNHPIPDVGAGVRAHLYRQGELWRVVFPNGLAPVADHEPLTDAAAIRGLELPRLHLLAARRGVDWYCWSRHGSSPQPAAGQAFPAPSTVCAMVTPL